jgi:hypothetical protein
MVLTRVIPWFSFFFLLLFTVKRIKTRVERPWIDFPIAFPWFYKTIGGGGMVLYIGFII